MPSRPGEATSNFPGLLLIGLPFYLLGNVGYLQLFSFILLSYTLYKTLSINKSMFYILLLVSSPAYWWEIIAISDLMSNVIIVFCFIKLWDYYFKDNTFKYPIVLGMILAILSLTRGIVFAPLVIYFFSRFLKTTIKNKLYFATSLFISSLLLIFISIKNCPNFETFKIYNPIVLQTSLVPKFITISSIIFPFLLSKSINQLTKKYYNTVLIFMLFPVLIAFYLGIQKFGVYELFYNKFDFSYFSMCFPFLIMHYVLKLKD